MLLYVNRCCLRKADCHATNQEDARTSARGGPGYQLVSRLTSRTWGW